MKKWIFLFFITFLPLFVHADNTQIIPKNESLYKVSSIEDIEKDLTKRMILGVLGKDALIYFLPSDTDDSVINQIKNLSDSEVDRISKPFNSSIISGTLILVSSFFLVAVTTMILYMIWLYIESLLRTQDSGQFLGDKWNKVFTPLKIIIGFALIFPMFGQSHAPFNKLSETSSGWNVGAFSLSQVAVIMSAGVSSQSANVIFGEFIRAMPKHYPAIKMPNVASKAPFMSDVIDFMVCAKSSYNKSIQLTFRRYDTLDSSVYKMHARAGKCEISGQVGYDEATVNDLETNNALREIVGNVNYKDMQLSAIKKAVQNMFNTAGQVADAIIVSEDTTNLIKSDIGISPSNWQDYCGNIAEQGKEDLTDKGLMLFNYYAANCLSKNFVEDLSKTSLSTAYIYSNQNYLKNNNIELCVHGGSTDANGEKSLTFAKVKEDEYSFSDNYKMISSCVQEVCTGDHIYECASAINFAKEMQEKEKIARMGWITGGANAYKIFSGRNNVNAMSVINKSSFSSSYSDDNADFIDLDANNGTVIDSFATTLNAVSPVSFDYSDFMSFIKDKSSDYDQAIIDGAQNKSLMDGGADGWFGIAKLQNCVENPMKISGGYVCGNVTEEIHLFGSKLLALGLQVKAVALLQNTNKGKVNKEVATVSKSALQTIGSMTKVLDRSAPIVIVTYLLGDTLITTDSFSDIDQEIWQQYPEVVSFLAAASVSLTTGGSVSQAVNQLITIFSNTLIGLGIVFGFIMPLLPFALWIVAIGGWVVALFEALVLAPIWGVILISPSKDHTADAARKSTVIIVSLLLKAPLLVTGLVLAWILNNILLSELLSFTDISQALALQPSEMIKGLIDQLIVLVIYFIMLYGIYNIIFSLIESFSDVAMDVLFGGKGISPFAQKQRGENWRTSVSTAARAISKG